MTAIPNQRYSPDGRQMAVPGPDPAGEPEVTEPDYPSKAHEKRIDYRPSDYERSMKNWGV